MTRRRNKWIIFILLVFLILFFAGKAIYSATVEKAVEMALAQVLTPKSYTYELGETQYGLLRGNLSVNQVSLYPNKKKDSSKQSLLRNEGQLVSLTVDGIEINGMSFIDVLIRKKLNLKEIKVDGLNVHLAKGSRKDTTLTNLGDESSTWLDSLQFMGVKRVTLDEIEINRTAVYFTDPVSGDTLDIYQGRSLRVNGLYFNARGESDFMRMYVDRLQFNLTNQKLEFPESGYTLTYSKLGYTAENQRLLIDNFRFGPTADPYQLASSYQFGKDVYKIKLPAVKTYGLRLRQLLRKGVFAADSIVMDSFELALFQDHKLPKNLNRKRLLPSEGIDSLGVPLNIARLSGKGGTIQYNDFLSEGQDFLETNLSGLDFEADNIISKHFPAQATDTLKITSTGRLSPSIPYTVELAYPYAKPETDLIFSGEIGPFQMEWVNPMVRPMEGIWFDEGYCEKIYFTASCTEQWCSGNMRFLYQDLKMSIEEKDESERSGLKSFLANIFIRKNNPVRNRIKVGDMGYERARHMSMVNLVTNGILKGIEDTVKP